TTQLLWRTHSAHVDARRCAHTLSDDEALQLNRKLWGNGIVHGTGYGRERKWHTPFSFSVNLLEALAKSTQILRESFERCGVQKSDHRHGALLRGCRERPRHRAAERG